MYFTVKLRRSILCCVLVLLLALGGAVCITALAAESEKVTVPVLMYHSVLKDQARQGKYVISPAEFERDLKYLKENGYTTVSPEDLIAYTEKKGDLPEKPVMLTFDDGYYNNYVYAYPLAQQYQAKITIAPIGYYSDAYSQEGEKLSAYYSHITWDQIAEMSASGLVEFGNHTYNLHKSDGSRLGAKRLNGENKEDYRHMLVEDVHQLQDKLAGVTGKESRCFVYPFGAVSKETPEIIKELGFKVTLTCEERVNTVVRNPDCLYDLGRYLRTQGRPAEKILSSLKN